MNGSMRSFVVESGLYQTKRWLPIPRENKGKGVMYRMADRKIAVYDPVALAQYLKYEYHIHDASFMEFSHNFYQFR